MTDVDNLILSFVSADLLAKEFKAERNSYFCTREETPVEVHQDYRFRGDHLVITAKRNDCWKKTRVDSDGVAFYGIPKHEWCESCVKRDVAHKNYQFWNRRRGARLANIVKYAKKKFRLEKVGTEESSPIYEDWIVSSEYFSKETEK